MSGGRRPGESGTRDAILTAARLAFGTQGYGATSVRAVGRDAGVDPSLVLHFFGSKDGLFEAALELPLDPAEIVAGLLADDLDTLGERVVRTFLGVWDGTPGQGPMLAMLRSAVSHEDSAAMLRELLLRVILRPVAQGAGGDRLDLRASLLASQIVGLALTRYVLKLEPVASASADDLAPLLGPTLQRYLTGAL
ncbi:MAG: TetR/AcrR family transcriptional regulator [Pseudorhodobacter sp.]|nr:TetR/AcrR family transcriptional regulator [Frankiaceae bacterium]